MDGSRRDGTVEEFYTLSSELGRFVPSERGQKCRLESSTLYKKATAVHVWVIDSEVYHKGSRGLTFCSQYVPLLFTRYFLSLSWSCSGCSGSELW